MELLDAFSLHPGDRVAIVGGGGKTTIMYRLAREAAARTWTAAVGGTTRFTPPRAGPIPPIVAVAMDDDPAPALRAALGVARTATLTTGRGEKGRWLPMSPAQADRIAAARVADLVIIEADGSRNRPFKAPGDDEPVIPASTSVVLCVAGLDVIGQPLTDEWVHRPEQVERLSGLATGAHLTAAGVAAVMLHPDGGRKSVPAVARWIAVLNKAEPPRLEAGATLAKILIDGGAELIVLTAAEAADPVVASFRRS